MIVKRNTFLFSAFIGALMLSCCGTTKGGYTFYKPKSSPIFPLSDSLYGQIKVTHRCDKSGIFKIFSNCTNDYVIRFAVYGDPGILRGKTVEYMSAKLVSESLSDTIDLFQKGDLKSIVPFSYCRDKELRTYCSEDVYFIGGELAEFATKEFWFVARVKLSTDGREFDVKRQFTVKD